MKEHELLRKLKKLARRRNVDFAEIPDRGKGGHVTVAFGGRESIVPRGRKEIRPGTLRAILRQLNIDPGDL